MAWSSQHSLLASLTWQMLFLRPFARLPSDDSNLELGRIMTSSNFNTEIAQTQPQSRTRDAGLGDYQPLLTDSLPLQRNGSRCSHGSSKLSAKTYKPWTRAGRGSLRRMILSSGPVYPSALLSEYLLNDQKRKGREEWRTGVLSSCIAICWCLVVEIVVIVLAPCTHCSQYRSGILVEGKGDGVKSLHTWLALPIPIIGITSTATTNYMVQCLNAHIRGEVDKAHAKGLLDEHRGCVSREHELPRPLKIRPMDTPSH